jgi:hypothetical protein
LIVQKGNHWDKGQNYKQKRICEDWPTTLNLKLDIHIRVLKQIAKVELS